MNPVAWLLERMLPAPSQSKAIIGLGDGLAEWAGVSRQDGTNFRTNTVTLSEYQDSGSAGAGGVLALAAAWACVNLLAGTIASLPLMVYRTRDGRRTVAADHPLYRVLHDSPNADQTALDTHGNTPHFRAAFAELSGLLGKAPAIEVLTEV